MASPARVLVVEDEEDLAAIVRVNLEIAGYDVDVARDGVEGLEAIRRDTPDLVLLDVMMPRMDGWSVLRHVKSDRATRDLPVVMLTALSEERELIRGHLQGAVEYVTKPFQMKRLLDAVDNALRSPDEAERDRRRARTRHLLQRLAELDSGRVARPSVRLSGLERAPGGQEPVDDAPLGDPDAVEGLTRKQRYLAAQMAAGRSARELAKELDVSRSNVYATRKRIARRLGVDPDQVPEAARRLGLLGDNGSPGA